MRRWLRPYVQRARRHFEAKALVLMYHRVAEPDTDVWNLAVSPRHFEQHLRVLRQAGTVVPAPELAERLRTRTLRHRSIAITFDDGYPDNYATAAPLLACYGLPATFFLISSQVGLAQEFWSDELVAIVLLAERLPASLALVLPDGRPLAADLAAEHLLTPALRQQHQHWRATEAAPPTRRAALYYELWQRLRPLPAPAQQVALEQLRAWAGQPAQVRPAHQSMTLPQLRELSAHPLFTIGAHTATHPALAYHPAAVQAHEMTTSRQALQAALGQPIELLAYPYGSGTPETFTIAAQAGFQAAFTTAAHAVTAASAPHSLGRFQVDDWDGATFERRLREWFAQ
jgi:peptidoglycan/xylan/chitin deacetylase (PgdA/CDA1 family)